MSSNVTNQQFTESEVILPEPHFDEEATVLSARPVVPLEQVESRKSKISLPRPLILGLGLAGALLVGILATVIYYSRADAGDALIPETEVSAGVEGNSNEAANVFSGPAASQPNMPIDAPADFKKQEPLKNQPARASSDADKKTRPRLVAVIRENKSSNDGDDEEEDREEALKAARKRARKERRRAEREQRDRRSSDELLRIRDIFEGSPRP